MIKKMIILALVALGLMVSGGAALYALDKQPIRAITPADLAKSLELKEREAALAAKEAELAKREQTQDQVRKELDEKLAKLTSIQSEIKDQLDAIKGVESAEFTNLVKIYSVMSPSKVAPLLNSMDDPAVVKIFRAMKVDQVAKIMPKLTQDKAVSVSQGLGLIDRQ